MTRQSILPWAAWFTASIAGMFQFMLQSSSSVMIGDLQNEFSINHLEVGLLSSSFFYTYMLCQVPAGMVLDILRPRFTIVLCQLGMSLLCVMFALSTSVWMAGASRILMGIFAAPSIIAAFYIAARRLPERYFILAVGLTETMVMIGGMLGEALLARSVTDYGWRSTMLWMAALSIFIMILSFFLINDYARSEFAEPDHPRSQTMIRDFMQMFIVPQSWINGLYAAFLFALIAAFGAFWCIPYLMELYDISLNKAADASSLIFVGAAMGAPFLAYVSYRIRSRIACMKIYAIGGLVTSVIVIYLPMSYMTICFAIFVLGFFSSAYVLPFDVMRSITSPSMRGTVMGFTNMMCILIGAPLMQPVIGWFLNSGEATVQAYQHAFIIVPAGLLLAFVLAFFVQKR